jgi:uncharacterized membrane protein YdbT with pleckstrin-like domain
MRGFSESRENRSRFSHAEIGRSEEGSTEKGQVERGQAESREQRAESREQRAESREQRAESREQSKGEVGTVAMKATLMELTLPGLPLAPLIMTAESKGPPPVYREECGANIRVDETVCQALSMLYQQHTV